MSTRLAFQSTICDSGLRSWAWKQCAGLLLLAYNFITSRSWKEFWFHLWSCIPVIYHFIALCSSCLCKKSNQSQLTSLERNFPKVKTDSSASSPGFKHNTAEPRSWSFAHKLIKKNNNKTVFGIEMMTIDAEDTDIFLSNRNSNMAIQYLIYKIRSNMWQNKPEQNVT